MAGATTHSTRMRNGSRGDLGGPGARTRREPNAVWYSPTVGCATDMRRALNAGGPVLRGRRSACATTAAPGRLFGTRQRTKRSIAIHHHMLFTGSSCRARSLESLSRRDDPRGRRDDNRTSIRTCANAVRVYLSTSHRQITHSVLVFGPHKLIYRCYYCYFFIVVALVEARLTRVHRQHGRRYDITVHARRVRVVRAGPRDVLRRVWVATAADAGQRDTYDAAADGRRR